MVLAVAISSGLAKARWARGSLVPDSPAALNTFHCPKATVIFTYPKSKHTPQTPKCKLIALALATDADEEKPFLCVFLHLGLTCGFSNSCKSLFFSFISLKQGKA